MAVVFVTELNVAETEFLHNFIEMQGYSLWIMLKVFISTSSAF